MYSEIDLTLNNSNITKFQQAKLNLDGHVDLLKHKVGLLGPLNTSRPFDPNTLEAQLNDIKVSLVASCDTLV